MAKPSRNDASTGGGAEERSARDAEAAGAREKRAVGREAVEGRLRGGKAQASRTKLGVMAREIGRTATCAGCGALITIDPNEDPTKRTPCECGETARNYGIELHERITLHDRLDTKARHPDAKKPFHESRTGDVEQADGTWKHVERLIDRENDIYREEVIDQESGEVVHFHEEPLSAHRGHGSAKPKRSS